MHEQLAALCSGHNAMTVLQWCRIFTEHNDSDSAEEQLVQDVHRTQRQCYSGRQEQLAQVVATVINNQSHLGQFFPTLSLHFDASQIK